MNKRMSMGQGRRRDRLIREQGHNTYKPAEKLAEPAVCPDCGAFYHAGRWQWGAGPENPENVRCEACQRIADDYPAGSVRLSGAFVRKHGDEIRNLAENEDAVEKEEHPLHRIMDISSEPDEIVIRTTDIHLPRRIGYAVYRAYKGELNVRYDPGGNFVQVSWERD